MDATRRLEIELPEALADFVEADVRSGRFANESEAVASALTLMREQDEDAADPELDAWLRDEVVAAYDKWKANPTGGIPIGEVSARLDEERKRRGQV